MTRIVDLLLLDGTAEGPKTASIDNWPGRATFSPVESAGSILKREEFGKPGIYILKSSPRKKVFNERVYIGESDTLRKRIKDHLGKISSKPFDSFVAFTSTDSLLNKATIKYLEHRLVDIAKQNKTSEISNRNTPSAPFLSEGKLYSMDAFLGQMKILLPLMGFEFLNPSVLKQEVKDEFLESNVEKDVESPEAENPEKESPPSIPDRVALYQLTDKKMVAFMYVRDGKFIVTKGSQMKKAESKTISSGWIRLRRRMLQEGMAVDDGQFYRLTEDVIFNSASASSSTLLGRQSPGPRVWVHTSNGMTYGQMLNEGIED